MYGEEDGEWRVYGETDGISDGDSDLSGKGKKTYENNNVTVLERSTICLVLNKTVIRKPDGTEEEIRDSQIVYSKDLNPEGINFIGHWDVTGVSKTFWGWQHKNCKRGPVGVNKHWIKLLVNIMKLYIWTAMYNFVFDVLFFFILLCVEYLDTLLNVLK